MTRNWPLIGAIAGGLLGLADYVLMRVGGVSVHLGDADITLQLMLVFGGTYALLGWALGRLVRARSTIAAQLAELEASRQRVVQAEKLAALGRVSAALAHEIRNPLGVMKSSAALIRDGVGEADQAPCDFIVEECDRLNALVTGLLAFARPEPLELGDVALVDVVASALRQAEEVASARSVAVEQSGVAGSVRGDSALLAQLVANLVVNAVQAAAGRVELRVDGGVVEVADDGPGVSNEQRETLFEPFVTGRAGGTGLGLATSARIAAAHGASLELMDGRGLGPGGRGACFRLELP